ncbi:MAG: NADH-quinone oxidoreductase subunit H [Candidatus Omnitrophica bacterium]|nr:NADH-quinone oxidoreductase subunit H [Candidatus Omnitrophota bacterium]
MKILIIFLQLGLFLVIPPFLSGLITKVKNNLRMRKGQSMFQPYYNLAKLFSKDEVVSETASWVFKITPFVVISSSLAAAAMIVTGNMADFLALIFVFALGRFFICLAALDAGSSFGGMGSSREMFISSLVEPAICLVIFSLSLQFGSTNFLAFTGTHSISVASLVSAVALFLITIAETSRVPIDNQETHLELTMIHEAMILEYSGRRLALIEMASYIKQMVLFFLIAQIVFPVCLPQGATLTVHAFWWVWYLARLFFIAVVVAFVEVSVAKMRLFRVADFIWFAFVLGIIATICAILGV